MSMSFNMVCQSSCGEASSQKLAAGQRTRLQWNNGSVRGAEQGGCEEPAN